MNNFDKSTRLRRGVLAVLVLLLGVSSQVMATTTAQPEAASKVQLNKTYGKLPLSFEPNVGQTDPQAQFLARGLGYSLFLTPTEAVLALRKAESNSQNQPPRPSGEEAGVRGNESKESLGGTVLRMQLVGANPNPQISGVDILPGKVNYFRGNDPKQWRTNIPTYAKAKYEQVYPGIDLIYYGNLRQLEYDFVVAPGANPRVIRFAFSGADKLTIDTHGDLVLSAIGSEVRLRKPDIYQEINGERRKVEGHFVRYENVRLENANSVENVQIGFQVAAYDKANPLIIDPVLAYSTFLGGSDYDTGTSIVIDGAGNAYVTGSTYSFDFPTTQGAFDTSNSGSPGLLNGEDVFITKLDASGSTLLYSTYLGGGRNEIAYSIAIDSDGNAYVTGQTQSSNFPTTPGAFDDSGPVNAGSDAFVIKLNASGSDLIYSTYLGGSRFESCYGIAVDSGGNAFVTGSTTSSGALESTPFPTTPDAYDTTYNSTNLGGDAFVTKFNANGTALIYSTFLGGSSEDTGHSIQLDGVGNAYITGEAGSDNFPVTPGAFDDSYNGHNSDVFVAKLNASGSTLLYSTYLGGDSSEEGNSIGLDGVGNAYITGWTYSTNFPITPGAFDSNNTGVNPRDAFVTKLDVTGTTLLYSTFLGGDERETAWSIVLDGAGNAYVTGGTYSTDFPTTPGAYDTTHNGVGDVFMSVVNTDGTTLLDSTFLGGSRDDVGYGIARDNAGNMYLTGYTERAFGSDPNFPTTSGAYDTSHNGLTDVFVAKISAALLQPGTIYLLLHGTASNPATWNDLVSERFSNDCPVVRLGLNITQVSSCYRHEFADKTLGDDVWKNGDGSTFLELGEDIARTVKKINDLLNPAAIILVGHSRGGLAARAYLQGITEQPPFKLGLLTIGTPHQGTPLGRVKHWLLKNGYLPKDVPLDTVLPPELIYPVKSLLFSPSVGYQATAHDVNRNPKRKDISEAIWRLNDGADRLDDWVSTFGQIYSVRLRLGRSVGNTGLNLLHGGTPLGKLIPGPFKPMRRFVLRNIGHDNEGNLIGDDDNGSWKCSQKDIWACNGDGIAPAISQQLTRLPGFSQGDKPLHSKKLSEIPHADISEANDGETGRILEINRVLDEIANDLQ